MCPPFASSASRIVTVSSSGNMLLSVSSASMKETDIVPPPVLRARSDDRAGFFPRVVARQRSGDRSNARARAFDFAGQASEPRGRESVEKRAKGRLTRSIRPRDSLLVRVVHQQRAGDRILVLPRARAELRGENAARRVLARAVELPRDVAYQSVQQTLRHLLVHVHGGKLRGHDLDFAARTRNASRRGVITHRLPLHVLVARLPHARDEIFIRGGIDRLHRRLRERPGHQLRGALRRGRELALERPRARLRVVPQRREFVVAVAGGGRGMRRREEPPPRAHLDFARLGATQRLQRAGNVERRSEGRRRRVDVPSEAASGVRERRGRARRRAGAVAPRAARGARRRRTAAAAAAVVVRDALKPQVRDDLVQLPPHRRDLVLRVAAVNWPRVRRGRRGLGARRRRRFRLRRRSVRRRRRRAVAVVRAEPLRQPRHLRVEHPQRRVVDRLFER
eukprot:31500-Pelagococcus_subviridis.AAC.5